MRGTVIDLHGRIYAHNKQLANISCNTSTKIEFTLFVLIVSNVLNSHVITLPQLFSGHDSSTESATEIGLHFILEGVPLL